MPMEQLLVQSTHDLESNVETALKNNRRVFVFFSGSTDLTTGDSWSNDCRLAEPVLEQCIQNTKETDLFLMIEVGTEKEWTDSNNYFQVHPLYKLREIPSLVSLALTNGQIEIISRLDGKACLDSSAVKKMFS